MLWVKAFHIIFVVTWFAGLFYLPRLFIYHALSEDESSRKQFEVMERRLFAIMTIGGTLATVFGIWLLVLNPVLLHVSWMHLKLALILGLVTYHVSCKHLMSRIAEEPTRYSQKWLRWYNEVPTFFLIAVVILAVVKPF